MRSRTRTSNRLPSGPVLLLLIFAGFCGSLMDRSDADSGGSSYAAVPLAAADNGYGATQQRETYYAHGQVNVRSGAGPSYAVVRTLSRGERIEVGEVDASGWAPAYDGGRRIGYVSLRGTRLRAEAPARRSETEPERHGARGHPAGATAICRDRTYSYSAHRRGTCSHHGGVAQWL
jgi:hypothetical protein